jgi:hypothetical protein
MAFRIAFIEWIDPSKLYTPSMLRPWLFPQFQISKEENYLFLINVSVPNGPVKARYRGREDQFKDALLRYSVRRIEDALRNESFLMRPPNGVQEIDIQTDELPIIGKLMEEKGSVIQVMLGSRFHGIVGQNHLSRQRRPAERYGRERGMSRVWIPAIQEKRPYSYREAEPSISSV